MKTLTKIELIALATQVFANNESVNEVHATEDGQIFYEANRANLHAGLFEKKLRVYPISRGEAELQSSKKGSNLKVEPRKEVTDEPESKKGKKAAAPASTNDKKVVPLVTPENTTPASETEDDKTEPEGSQTESQTTQDPQPSTTKETEK